MTEKGDKISNKNSSQLNSSLHLYAESTFIIIPPKLKINQINPNEDSLSLQNKITNQLKIKNIFNYFYNNKINKIKSKLTRLEKDEEKYQNQYNNLELNYNFEKFKSLLSNMDNYILNEFNVVNKSIIDFKEIFNIFKCELKEAKKQAENLISIYNDKISDNLITPSNNNNITIEVLLAKYKNNQKKIEKLFNDNNENNFKKIFIHKISELNLYNESLELNFGISNIPQLFQNELEEIKIEVKRRKNFDFCFQYMIDMIEKDLIPLEEIKRNEFQKKRNINIQINHEIYSKIINELCKQNMMKKNDNMNADLFNKLNNIKNEFKKLMNLANYKNNSIQMTNDDSQLRLDNIKKELESILLNNYKIKTDTNTSIEEMLMKLKKQTLLKPLGSFILNNSSLEQSILFENYKKSIKIQEQNESFNIQNSTVSLYAKNSNNILNLIKKFEKQLMFYETLFGYLQNYLQKENIKERFVLEKENPETLVEVIDKIVRENFSYKKIFLDYHKKHSE